MAINNPQAVLFCNEDVRPAADVMLGLYWRAKQFVTEWNAQGMGALIPNTADVVEDGSATDGRAPITGAKVNGLFTALSNFCTDLEANGGTKLNTLTQIAVNPRS